MSRNLTAYRVMAAIVGVLLVVLCLVGVPLANFDGTPMWGVFDSTPTWFATGSDEVTGWLQAPEGSLGTDDDPDDDVFPEIRVADAVQRVDVDLYSAYLISQEPAPGLEPAELAALPEPGRFTGVRNLLSAVEWWVFGAFAAFIWWRWRQDATAPEVAPLEQPAGR